MELISSLQQETVTIVIPLIACIDLKQLSKYHADISYYLQATSDWPTPGLGLPLTLADAEVPLALITVLISFVTSTISLVF